MMQMRDFTEEETGMPLLFQHKPLSYFTGQRVLPFGEQTVWGQVTSTPPQEVLLSTQYFTGWD